MLANIDRKKVLQITTFMAVRAMRAVLCDVLENAALLTYHVGGREALSKVGHHATGVSVGFYHEPSDDLDLLRIARRVDHYYILRYVAHKGHGVLLCPALASWATSGESAACRLASGMG